MLKTTQEDIAKRLGIDRTTVSKVLNNAPGTYVGERTRVRIFDLARKLGYNFSRLRHTHRRNADRRIVQIPATIQIVLWDGSVYASGEATVVNLSADGAMLADVELKPPSIPIKPCYMTLSFTLEDLGEHAKGRKTPGTKLSLRADIVRLRMVRFVEIAVKFVEIAEDAIRIIELFLQQRMIQLQEADEAADAT
jgi:transcriptional regulator with XRE-family HTH domain